MAGIRVILLTLITAASYPNANGQSFKEFSQRLLHQVHYAHESQGILRIDEVAGIYGRMFDGQQVGYSLLYEVSDIFYAGLRLMHYRYPMHVQYTRLNPNLYFGRRYEVFHFIPAIEGRLTLYKPESEKTELGIGLWTGPIINQRISWEGSFKRLHYLNLSLFWSYHASESIWLDFSMGFANWHGLADFFLDDPTSPLYPTINGDVSPPLLLTVSLGLR